MGQIPTLNPLSAVGSAVQRATTITACVSPGNRNSGQPGGIYEEPDTDDIIVRPLKTYRNGSETGVLSEFKKYGVSSRGEDILVPVEIVAYLDPMINAAAADGVTLQVTSGFRTMEYQERLKRELGATAAQPGFSPHQVGYAVDFSTRGTGQYEWMVRNAYRYGFVRTVVRERWHWEYRGTWDGQERPSWAAPTARSMFQFVAADHACGASPNGGSAKMKSDYWFRRSGTHPDEVTRGATNSWTGPDGSYLPAKFDQQFPGWDTA